MKIVCTTDFDEFRPDPFDRDSVEDIVNDVYTSVLNKYGKRFKNISVDIDDILYDDSSISFYVDVFNGSSLKLEGEFEFIPYSDYWDLTDYEQHKAITISKFVNNLVEN